VSQVEIMLQLEEELFINATHDDKGICSHENAHFLK